MIDRITLHDDEQGPFVYERDQAEPFKWRLVQAGARDGEPILLRDGGVPQLGSDVLWQAAIGCLDGVDT